MVDVWSIASGGRDGTPFGGWSIIVTPCASTSPASRPAVALAPQDGVGHVPEVGQASPTP
ncbi:MAG: hypothetical protein IPO58_17455 [Betaproteobacteria bacterium]|nr:hypothetical protein [Betaproteobacteria bacterium]